MALANTRNAFLDGDRTGEHITVTLGAADQGELARIDRRMRELWTQTGSALA